MAHTNTHNVHLECHDPYKIHIMYTYHDSEGAYFVEYTVEEFEKFLII
jgi:hypothetical protein